MRFRRGRHFLIETATKCFFDTHQGSIWAPFWSHFGGRGLFFWQGQTDRAQGQTDMEQGQTDRKQNRRKSDFEDLVWSPFFNRCWALTHPRMQKVRILSDLFRGLDVHHFLIRFGNQKSSIFNGLERWWIFTKHSK